MAIDIHKLYQNVRIFAKRRNIPINILEENLGVDLGYFARAENKELIPPIGTTAKLAGIFNCPIDMLTNTDASQLTDTDFYVHDFMQKLGEETQDNMISWSKTSDGYYTAPILEDKDIFISGVSPSGSWGKLKIWMEDHETQSDDKPSNEPVEQTDAETSQSGTDSAANNKADGVAETPPAKKEYVVYDVKKSYRDTFIHKHAKDTALLIQRIADQPIDQETIAIVKRFLHGNPSESEESNTEA